MCQLRGLDFPDQAMLAELEAIERTQGYPRGTGGDRLRCVVLKLMTLERAIKINSLFLLAGFPRFSAPSVSRSFSTAPLPWHACSWQHWCPASLAVRSVSSVELSHLGCDSHNRSSSNETTDDSEISVHFGELRKDGMAFTSA